MAEMSKLKRDVEVLREQTGFNDPKGLTYRDAYSVTFDAFYKFHGHHELDEVEDRLIADAKSRDAEAFVWRWSEAEFLQIAYAMLGHVVSVVAGDSPSREVVDARLKKLGSPLRVADLLDDAKRFTETTATPTRRETKPTIPEKWRGEESG